MKDLESASKNEKDAFFDSIEYVLCDVDGVLRRLYDPIPGAKEAIKALKNLNKRVIFVSNNCTKSHERYYRELKDAGFDLDENDLVVPVLAMIDFLKRQNFAKEIFLLGMTSIRKQLEDSGFKIENFIYENPEESIPKFVKESIQISPHVGAVVVDIDVNLNVAQLSRAITYLKNPEIFFITGGADKQLYFGPGQTMIGPGSFHNILEEMSGRKSYRLAKPNVEYNDYIKEKFGINDPEKVLFIGDSIPEDMGFATKCGYKKLLVLSGLTQKETIQNWTFPEEYKPNYYVNSLQNVYDLLPKK